MKKASLSTKFSGRRRWSAGRRLLLVIISLLFPSLAAAQLDGHFYLSKSSYSAGEPIFLIFAVENKGTEPVMIRTADPISFCGGYKIEVSRAKSQDHFGCNGGFGGSCPSSDEILDLGKKHTDRILLNRSYDLRQAGRYALRVHHNLPYTGANGELAQLARPDATQENFDADLEIIIEPSQESLLKTEFQEYVQELQSSDSRQKLEAAQVIANLAPPFLEETIIHMLDSEQWSYLGVRGLRNLGTPSAHRALVAFVKNSEPTPISGAYQEAIRYIGEAGGRNDLDMLLEVAHSNSAESSSRELAIEAAGEVGGDDAVPLLARETKNPSIDTRQAAVRGLYLGGSRKAVPLLIELLRSPEERVNGTAEFGLQVLTHRFPAGTSTKENPSSAYLKWIHWWNTHRDTATIFKYDECGESLPFE